MVVTCGCGKHRVPSYCGRRDCGAEGGPAECKAAVQDRRALEVEARFPFDGKAGPIGYTVFTVPPWMRATLADREKWDEARRRAWALLKAEGGLYGIEATHPVGDPPPCPSPSCGSRRTEWDWTTAPLRGRCTTCGTELAEAEFHPHLNFLWRKKGGLTPWLRIDQRGVLRLAFAWARVLEELTGLGAGASGFVVVHHNYVKSTGQRAHRARYVTRLFPGFHTWLGNVRWYGKPPRLPEEETEDRCRRCGHCRDVTRLLPLDVAERIMGKRGPAPKLKGFDIGDGRFEMTLDYLQDYDPPEESAEGLDPPPGRVARGV